jgi:hypothetical protein
MGYMNNGDVVDVSAHMFVLVRMYVVGKVPYCSCIVCVCVCVCVQNMFLHVCSQTESFLMFPALCVCVCEYVYVCVYIYIYIYITLLYTILILTCVPVCTVWKGVPEGRPKGTFARQGWHYDRLCHGAGMYVFMHPYMHM